MSNPDHPHDLLAALCWRAGRSQSHIELECLYRITLAYVDYASIALPLHAITTAIARAITENHETTP